MSDPVVLDASALLCLLNDERGADRVLAALPRAVIGAANLAEVVGKLVDRGLSEDEVAEMLSALDLDVKPMTRAQAIAAGYLRASTASLGLSLGDRACLALARELERPALTADKAWRAVKVKGLKVEVLR